MSGRTFLIVSAPFGPFARELRRALAGRGARALRVVLNGGDALDWGGAADALTYRGKIGGWDAWLRRALAAHAVTDVVTYGDSSRYAAAALRAAADRGLATHVLEQGYFRPDWITLERAGVNANSQLPRDPSWYRRQAGAEIDRPPAHVGRTAPAAVARITAYHAAVYAAAPWFGSWQADYSEPAWRQALGHTLRLAAQWASQNHHRRAFERLAAAEGPLFLCALQRPGDSQLRLHSDFGSSAEFVEHVVASFARGAPASAHLVVRPHPLDPGLNPHARHLRAAAQRCGVAARVHFIDYGKLHEVLPHFAGVVCVNSTAGLAAIEFGKPTITLGRAIYDMPGMTHHGPLDAFWAAPQAPDRGLYGAFRRTVIAATQVNGAFATARGRRLAIKGVADRLMSPGYAVAGFSTPTTADRARSRSDQPIAARVAAAAVLD